MKSSIKVDFADLGNGIEPIIRVKAITSDDPRDSLIKTLFQNTSLLQVDFVDCKHGQNEEGLPIMDKTILLYKPKGFNVHDNSIGFRQYLDEKGIKWKANEHFTTILDGNIDLFQLGRNVEKCKQENS